MTDPIRVGSVWRNHRSRQVSVVIRVTPASVTIRNASGSINNGPATWLLERYENVSAQEALDSDGAA